MKKFSSKIIGTMFLEFRYRESKFYLSSMKRDLVIKLTQSNT